MKTAPSQRSAKRKRSGGSENTPRCSIVYMEEPPLVSDWRKLTKTPNVIAVPFFISDGLHSYEDIPRLLGMVIDAGVDRGQPGSTPPVTPHGEIFRSNPYKIDNRSLFYAPSIGTDPGVVDIIIEQANAVAKS